MRDLFRANLRRDLIAAGMLLAFATIAMAAAQWGTFSPGELASLTGEKDVAFMGDVDHRLPSASADVPRVPMFTTGGSPVAEGALPADSVLPPLPDVAAASAATSGGTVAPAENWHAPAGFGSGERSPFLRGASSSSSGVGSIAGIGGGGGAWGGVSGTGKTKETIVAGASSRIVAAAPAARANSGSSGGSSGGSRPAASSGPAFSAHAAAPVAPAFQHPAGPPLGDPAPSAGKGHDSPSSAPTPEPLSFILVGVGLAGIYAVRKHLR